MADDDSGRCWPGYTPVPGKSPHEQGSCRPKAKSKLSAKERKVREERERQLEERAKQPARTGEAMPDPESVPKTHDRKKWARHREEEVKRTGEQNAKRRRTKSGSAKSGRQPSAKRKSERASE